MNAEFSSLAKRLAKDHPKTNEHLIAAQMNPQLAAALVLVANYFEDEARKEENTDSPLVVKHHKDDGHGRAYVRVLGGLTRKLFGDSLYRTVATTASVALQQDIDWQQAREWLRR